jgi:serine protease inhibitor
MTVRGGVLRASERRLRRAASIAMIALLSATVAGCGRASEAAGRGVGDPPAIRSSVLPGKATEQLGLQLMRRLGSGNLAFSPDSVAAAIAMVGTGARGATATGIAHVLHLTSPAGLPSVGALQRAIVAGGSTPSGANQEAPTLQIANGMFLEQGYPLEAPFTAGLEQSFGVVPESVDFQSPAGTEAINAWVAEQTHGLIPQVVTKLSPETRLALANAIYLKAKWSERFKPGASAPAPFHGATGTTSTVFMHKTEQLSYARGRGYAAVALPYADSTLSLLVVLPVRQSLPSLERQLQPSSLDRIVHSLSKREVRLSLPRFHLHTQKILNGPLTALGMGRALSESAEFSGITKAETLKIGEVAHAADLMVDEEGTIAAASTVVTVEPTLARVPVPVVAFDADRPFLFFLRDERSGALLFAGRLVTPQD